MHVKIKKYIYKIEFSKYNIYMGEEKFREVGGVWRFILSVLALQWANLVICIFWVYALKLVASPMKFF